MKENLVDKDFRLSFAAVFKTERHIVLPEVNTQK
jgi:hypothetical protein